MKHSALRIVFLTSLFAALSVFNSCDRESCCEDGFTLYRFSGTVTDSITNLPIDSALVTLDDTTMGVIEFYTDTSGYYEGEAMGGNYAVFARKTGYSTKSRLILLNANLSNVNFQLVP